MGLLKLRDMSGVYSSILEHLVSIHKALGLIPSKANNPKPDVMGWYVSTLPASGAGGGGNDRKIASGLRLVKQNRFGRAIFYNMREGYSA